MLGCFFDADAARDFRLWHLTDISASPAFVRYWGHRGHCWILALDGSVANGTKRTLGLISTWDRLYATHSVRPLKSETVA